MDRIITPLFLNSMQTTHKRMYY